MYLLFRNTLYKFSILILLFLSINAFPNSDPTWPREFFNGLELSPKVMQVSDELAKHDIRRVETQFDGKYRKMDFYHDGYIDSSYFFSGDFKRGKYSEKTSYTYDSSNQVIKTITQTKKRIYENINYEYTKTGKISSIKFYSENGIYLKYNIKISYDSLDRVRYYFKEQWDCPNVKNVWETTYKINLQFIKEENGLYLLADSTKKQKYWVNSQNEIVKFTDQINILTDSLSIRKIDSSSFEKLFYQNNVLYKKEEYRNELCIKVEQYTELRYCGTYLLTDPNANGRNNLLSTTQYIYDNSGNLIINYNESLREDFCIAYFYNNRGLLYFEMNGGSKKRIIYHQRID